MSFKIPKISLKQKNKKKTDANDTGENNNSPERQAAGSTEDTGKGKRKVIKSRKRSRKNVSLPQVPLPIMVAAGVVVFAIVALTAYNKLKDSKPKAPDTYQILEWDGGKVAGVQSGEYHPEEASEEDGKPEKKSLKEQEISSSKKDSPVSETEDKRNSDKASTVSDIQPQAEQRTEEETNVKDISTEYSDYDIGEYDNTFPYTVVNNNNPFFTGEEIASAFESYEYYSPLDRLGRCGYTEASIGTNIMPTEERGEIGMVKPSGWCQMKYPELIEGAGYLYNRCHLIGYQLSGENANERNLITGTRYLNVEGMLPFEDTVADYVKGTGNHVLYRVTPLYEGEEPLSRGVLMEAESVEDGGEGIRFNVFCYNVQPGIAIDYKDGTSRIIEESTTPTYG